MEEAEAYVRSRRLFGTFSPEILDAWLSSGLRVCPDTGKVTLVFSRDAEALMYKTTPTETPLIGFKNGNMNQYDAVQQRGHFLYSSRYKFLDRSDVGFLKERFQGFEFGGEDEGFRSRSERARGAKRRYAPAKARQDPNVSQRRCEAKTLVVVIVMSHPALSSSEFDEEHFWPMINPEGFVDRVKDCV